MYLGVAFNFLRPRFAISNESIDENLEVDGR
jgi:hypothetical protein